MAGSNIYDPMMDMFIFETSQLIEQLELLILNNEKSQKYDEAAINEIFRIMHTIKGSAAMMLFSSITSLAHSIEDLFFFIREENLKNYNYSDLSELVLEGIDFIKSEIEQIKVQGKSSSSADGLTERIKSFLAALKLQIPSLVSLEDKDVNQQEKQRYYIGPDKSTASQCNNIFKALLFFDEGCEMENIRAFNVIHSLKGITDEIVYKPEDIIENDDSAQVIKEKGFEIIFKTDCSAEEAHKILMKTVFLKDLEFIGLTDDTEYEERKKSRRPSVEQSPIKIPMFRESEKTDSGDEEKSIQSTVPQGIISVNVGKLDKLMDLVGELVISEAMVTQNPDLRGLELENFHKASRQLHKITGELQDMVMAIRMVPLTSTFQRMNRVVYDMCKKLGKEVGLEIVGEETEVDKNIIEHISDPLMHLVRNAVDHGLESQEERKGKGKPQAGKLTLEARNAGSDVLIIVKDDGKGLNRESILRKAYKNGLLDKTAEEMTDKEIFSLILLPGFSTKDAITEFSGRGVGMDVVTKNIDKVGGAVSVDSTEGEGTTITLKIPLTLAIIDGMNISVGNARYTIPIMSIRESFRAEQKDIIADPDGNEMIMVRGRCYPVLRLHEAYNVKTDVTGIHEGIIVMIESDESTLCVFADALLGEQQVVVKTLPSYIKNRKNIEGVAGCTLLGDGSISLILDTAGLVRLWEKKVRSLNEKLG